MLLVLLSYHVSLCHSFGLSLARFW